MALRQLNHFNIRAPQPLMAAVRDFYVNVIGLKPGFRPELGFAGYWLYLDDLAVLHIMDWPAGSASPSGERGYLDHIAFTCDDIDGFLARFDSMGITFIRRDYPRDDGNGFTQLEVSDPTGLGVELNFPHSLN